MPLRIKEFDPEKEDWRDYIEQVEQYFIAHSLKGDDKEPTRRALFLSGVGSSTYVTLKSLLAPTKPADKKFEEIVSVLTKYYSPPPSEVVQSYRFFSRVRQPGETVAAFVAALRRLAKDCNFGDSMSRILRDKIVFSIGDDTIQKKLLDETKLTYERAVELAESAEAAAKGQKEMRSPLKPADSPDPVQTVMTGKEAKAIVCHRCANPGHLATVCRFKDKVCHNCKKRGHIARACRSKTQPQPHRTRTPRARRRNVHHVGEEDPSSEDSDYSAIDFVVDAVGTGERGERDAPITVCMAVDGQPVNMEVDTGAAKTIMPEKAFRKLWPGRSLDKTDVRLQSYLGEPIPVVGSVIVQVEYEDQRANLPLIVHVVKGNRPTLLGRSWLGKVRLNWSQINYTQRPQLHVLLDKYSEVFSEELGTMVGQKATIDITPEAKPRFHKARTVPYAYRQKVEDELTRLVSEGILEPIDSSEWAAPIVPVIKSDKKSVRICGDFRVTVNPVSRLHRYPIPKIEDLFATLKGGKVFTKIDLSQAYQQLILDDESRDLCVINTHKGLYRYTRLPFGVASAPGIFQKTMEKLLHGIPGVVVYIDDILIASPTNDEHLTALEEVLKRLHSANLRAKKSKCRFLVPSVSYLGYKLDGEGLHPLPEKVKAIQEAPIPRNVSELKSYLGLLTYYAKFLPNLSTHLAPLYRLLRCDTRWQWSTAQQKAFEKSKELLVSSKLLIHFDSSLPLVLACDASQYGIGAVLAHRLPDGSERPIGYVSRTLNIAERNYSQLEKEGLACVFGVKRFYSYLFGHSFQLITDHKPLLGLLSECKSTSPQASARIRRWSLYLLQFEYRLTFRGTKAHANADALSRLPLPSFPDIQQPPAEVVLLCQHLDDSPVTAKHIQDGTSKDALLSIVAQYVLQGWPNSVASQPALRPFFERKLELSVHQGCILWGSRVVIPEKYREHVLSQLHEGHPGMARMKNLSRMYVWWPGISTDIESTVRECQQCQLHQSVPPVAPLQPWSWPTSPWTRLHLDYAGPFEGKMILVLIDAHSKWIEAIHTPNATSTVVIEELREKFAQFGIPQTIVTDNGSCFTSVEFESFLSANGIHHLTTAPYHPASNGLAERAVQIIKKGLKKNKNGTFHTRLSRTLFSYRLTPQTTTSVSPAELLLKRRPRSKLDLLRPNLTERVEKQQRSQKEQHDSHSREREFAIGTKVWVRNMQRGNKWLPGTILSKDGSVTYDVEMTNGRVRKCHTDQLRVRTVSVEQSIPTHSPLTSSAIVSPNNAGQGNDPSEVPDSRPEEPESNVNAPSAEPPNEQSSNETPVEPTRNEPEPRRSTRAHQPVVRYEPQW